MQTVQLTAVEIGNAGEKIVHNDLALKGYTNILRDTKQTGSVDIQADSTKMGNILVQVKTAIYPSVPAELTSEENTAIKAKGQRTSRTPKSARLQINDSKQLVGSIIYTDL